jgi:hypothetical protein
MLLTFEKNKQVIYTMHRFIIVDAHAVKVCNIKGELVSVPLGPQGNTNDGRDSDSNPNATKMGCNTDGQGGKTISWRSYIENGMDRPRVLWDGSFLWIAETHLRKLDGKTSIFGDITRFILEIY